MKFNLPKVQNGMVVKVNILNFVDEWNRMNGAEMKVEETGGYVFWAIRRSPKSNRAMESSCFNTFTELAEYLDGFILGIELAQKK